MRRGVVLLVLLATGPGCAAVLIPRFCADGAPPKVLQHPDCRRGICGYTCAPDRWKPDPPRSTQ